MEPAAASRVHCLEVEVGVEPLGEEADFLEGVAWLSQEGPWSVEEEGVDKGPHTREMNQVARTQRGGGASHGGREMLQRRGGGQSPEGEGVSYQGGRRARRRTAVGRP